MRKIPTGLLFVTALLILFPTTNALAQSETPRVEFGAQYTLLRLKAGSPINDPILQITVPDFVATDHGFGGRLTFNLTDFIGLESEINHFPEERANFAEPLYINSRRLQGLFGVKAGVRDKKKGLFGKLRPGFIHFGEGTPDPRIQTLVPVPPRAGSTEFALDIGGVLEFYPSLHTALRFDLGDTIIRYGRGNVSGRPSFTSHNLQLSIGVGFRF
ncbi:MAG TPA: hypothetical protein PLD20_30445 [Blastocatellia bacterium]|nr:hypothetical protein [Blastocatellia bacterium]HMX26647.1 hypothetical protein [Blastocatellia bacterium]HMY76114.1 hypothetical protein [Blastocatellia bacterium]HMZ22291.1 hypothetical protein [Blastocatellia bacterium]HNG31951.1 hypothetical protein [Blastocatellia bacterium]